MSSEIELDDLHRARASARFASTGSPPAVKNDSSATYWAWGAGAICASAAVPLIAFPQFLLFIAETGAMDRRVAMTPLESFFSLHVGILLVALALALIFNVPQQSTQPLRRAEGSSHPLLIPITGACSLISLISYNTTSVGPLAFLVFLGTLVISAWGAWAILFQGSSYISKKTGADKRTSRFIFGNKAAASAQKKIWQDEQATQKKVPVRIYA